MLYLVANIYKFPTSKKKVDLAAKSQPGHTSERSENKFCKSVSAVSAKLSLKLADAIILKLQLLCGWNY